MLKIALIEFDLSPVNKIAIKKQKNNNNKGKCNFFYL